MSEEKTMCQQSSSDKEAFAIAHWPGKDSAQCREHCMALARFYKMVWGGDVHFTDLKTGQSLRAVEMPQANE